MISKITTVTTSYAELVAALKMAKPIVGAAVAKSENKDRELRQKVYDKIEKALACIDRSKL